MNVWVRAPMHMHRGHRKTLSILLIIWLILLRQGLSLTLELGWQPASLKILSSHASNRAGVTGTRTSHIQFLILVLEI